MEMRVLVNGKKQTSISVFERVVQFGDDIFKTLLVRHGKILYWDLHFKRLCLGLVRLKINLISTQDLLIDISKIKNPYLTDEIVL